MSLMSDRACEVAPAREPPRSPVKLVVYKALNNRLVEAVIVAAIAACFLATTVLDGIFGTRLERGFIDRLRDVSRDRLSRLRKAQIKYVFRCKYGLKKIRIRLAGGSYWLSIPCIVEGKKDGKYCRYMAKIINDASAIKHRYMTMLRNLGVLAGAAEMHFDEYADAEDMVNFERYCLTRIREQSLNAPSVIGIHRLNREDYMLVTEFIEGRPLSEVPLGGSEIDQIFGIIKTMHDHEFVHGDVKLDNFLASRDKVYVVDCLKVGGTRLAAAKAFDVICALCALSQKAPVSTVMAHARKYFSSDDLLEAGAMLEVALSKADIDLPPDRARELRRALGNAA
jgi:tRNA A-37 threonylcarbamoyl transferase component Bud32